MCRLVFVTFFFFFKQKTAYEMRISDWSSDVCSSDLTHRVWVTTRAAPVSSARQGILLQHLRFRPCLVRHWPGKPLRCCSRQKAICSNWELAREIGRASCRERVGQYV